MQKNNDTKFECNCYKEWSKKCKNRTTWLSERNDFEIYPQQHWLYYEEYRAKDIISGTKNDRVLYNYLIDNNLLGEKLCYLEIANKLLLKDGEYYLNKEEENVDSILDYLYWSYGDPCDKNNLLRKYFEKEAMKNYKCNCKEEWMKKCWSRSQGFQFIGCSNISGVFNIIPQWVKYGMLYSDFIDPGKKDETLTDFLLRNYNGEFCYLKIAKWAVEKTRLHLYYKIDNEEDLIDCIMSYLYLSYGDSCDEYNILKVMMDIKKLRKKNRKEKVDNRLPLKDSSNIDVLNHIYKPKDKKGSNNIIIKSGYVRDARVRELALQLANFQCEIDKEHVTFISKATLKDYVESHHLIPMAYYNEFQYSIDNEADIVALCPNCHRCLHLGRFEDKKILVERLYYKHIESLKKTGIEITLEGLLEMYAD